MRLRKIVQMVPDEQSASKLQCRASPRTTLTTNSLHSDHLDRFCMIASKATPAAKKPACLMPGQTCALPTPYQDVSHKPGTEGCDVISGARGLLQAGHHPGKLINAALPLWLCSSTVDCSVQQLEHLILGDGLCSA